MSTFVWCEFTCTNCTNTTSGRFTRTTLPRAAMLRDAKSRGWVRGKIRTEEIFCCEGCRKTYEED